MTEQEMVNYIRDWFPVGDPHFEDSTDYLAEGRYAIDFLEVITGGIR
jgi:hypothetical protein